MARGKSVLAWFSAILLTASIASAQSGLAVAPASVPPKVDARTRDAVHAAVAGDLANNEAATALDGYTLFPKLVELRRFVEGKDGKNKDQANLVCVIELTVVNRAGAVVARSRASANSQTATPAETIDAAAQAATARLAVSLEALSRAEARDKVVAHR